MNRIEKGYLIVILICTIIINILTDSNPICYIAINFFFYPKLLTKKFLLIEESVKGTNGKSCYIEEFVHNFFEDLLATEFLDVVVDGGLDVEKDVGAES